MVEDTELVHTLPAPDDGVHPGGEEEAEVKLLVGAEPGENVRHPGSDARKDDMVLDHGTLLSSLGGEIGTLAFVGVTAVRLILSGGLGYFFDAHCHAPLQVKVYRKPIVAVLSTGNEVVDLQRPRDQSSEPGRDGWTGTFDTNRPSLTAALQGMGYEVIDYGVVSDELRTIHNLQT